MSYRILVLEGITERGLQALRAEGWTVDVHPAMPPSELAGLISPYQAMMIRSGSRVTAEVIDAAKSLRIIGRPGVGVDNVDLAAATRRGIVVMRQTVGGAQSVVTRQRSSTASIAFASKRA